MRGETVKKNHLLSLVKFVRLSASIIAAPIGRIFVKFETEEIY
jgi:hypothetical protein